MSGGIYHPTPKSFGLRTEKQYLNLVDHRSLAFRHFSYRKYFIRYMCIHDHETMRILPHPDLIRLPVAHMPL